LNWWQRGLAGLGALPFVPLTGGMVKKIGSKIGKGDSKKLTELVDDAFPMLETRDMFGGG